MRILLLHPEDEPLAGPWLNQPWDIVFDLGRAGWVACERWTRAFGCPVRPMDGLKDGLREIQKVRELLCLGRGELVDREGIDWWELTALLVHEHLEKLVLLQKFAEQVACGAQVFITRDGLEARALRLMLGDRLQVIDPNAGVQRKGPKHYTRRIKHLSVSQILDVLGDKYDGAYGLRRYLHRRPTGRKEPVVLLPTAYVNVSLLGTAYARILPDTEFLMVSTRRSGRLRQAPANVQQEWLASYADQPSGRERRDMVERWDAMQSDIGEVKELAILRRLGLMQDFARRIAEGLAIRDAWKNVFNLEPVEAVLCGDDSNPYIHLPLLLARKRGLPAIACHHGAFDGRYLFKTNHADVILAKGRMEYDYLVNVCGVDAGEVEIGAPGVPETRRATSLEERRESIVFFSEPYEIAQGRTAEIYRDVLPLLVELAGRCGKKLVVKLHPAESEGARKSLAVKVLTPEQMARVEWRTGPLRAEWLNDAWFGVAVLSSVALDCVVHGVPCFLCEWLDLWPYGYVSQFRKFGVGIGLSAPDEIGRIPEILGGWRPDLKIIENCWQVISSERLRELLREGRQSQPAYGIHAAS
jgi:hypothetical protein